MAKMDEDEDIDEDEDKEIAMSDVVDGTGEAIRGDEVHFMFRWVH